MVKILAAVLVGLEAQVVEVEVTAINGLPALVIVGLASNAVGEAKDRLVTALKGLGIRPKARRTVINLAPAELKKTSAALDLAMAVGLAQLTQPSSHRLVPANTIWLGELSLSGQIKPVRHLLPLLASLHRQGYRQVVIPAAQLSSVPAIAGLKIFPLAHLSTVLACQQQQLQLVVHQPPTASAPPPQTPADTINWSLFNHQPDAARAMVLAAAGGHHLLLQGPPGCGKTSLAQEMVKLLPPLTAAEQLSLQTIASLRQQPDLPSGQRPVRQPHHRTTRWQLLGQPPRTPGGELVLAHLGVLILDEISEFSRATLEALRTPLQTRAVTNYTASGEVSFPADCLCVATTNPCPCGWFGASTPTHHCQCNPHQIKAYQQRLSTALLDRFELGVWLEPSQLDAAIVEYGPNTLAAITQARQRQTQRWGSSMTNAAVPWTTLQATAQLSMPAQQYLQKNAVSLTYRQHDQLVRVGQTVADLSQDPRIELAHLQQAAYYQQGKKPTGVVT